MDLFLFGNQFFFVDESFFKIKIGILFGLAGLKMVN